MNKNGIRKVIPFVVLVSSMAGLDVAYAKYRPQSQMGIASYYGERFHGRKTANGERFNKNELTAAHRSYPFGTVLQVTNLRNNKTVTVRVNDRGPYVGGRIIDLSKRAARDLGFVGNGVAHVEIEVLGGKKPTKASKEPEADKSSAAMKPAGKSPTRNTKTGEKYILPTEANMLW